MLRIFDCICKNHKIRYWLDYRTLLGAICHKGFMPWDYHLDIGMLKEDYSLFIINGVSELPCDILFQTEDSSIELERSLIAARLHTDYDNSANCEAGDVSCRKSLNLNFFIYDWDDTCEYISNSFEKRLSNSRIHLKKEEIASLDSALFDDDEYYIPSGYHSYLQRCYGNYMELPPENERKLSAIAFFDNYSFKTLRIKILFCIDTLWGGGAQKILITFLDRINYEKYDVDLLILTEYGVYFSDIFPMVHCFTPEDKKFMQKNYDIEIAFLEGHPTKYIANKKSNAKKIAWVHTDLFNLHWSKNYYTDYTEEEECYSQMDKIIFVSQDARSQFNKLFPNVKTPQSVIYNFTDRKEIERKAALYEVEKRRFTICCVGRMDENKGYRRLIPIIHQLCEEGFSFDVWFIGGGVLMSEIHFLIDEYSLDDVIFLQGFHKNPYPYIKAVDVFLSCSYVEGYSLVISEAFCLGKPVISTLCAGTRELLENGEYGLLVEQDPVSIYNGLKEMISNEELRTYYGKKSVERSEIFNAENTMQLIYDNLDSLIK